MQAFITIFARRNCHPIKRQPGPVKATITIWSARCLSLGAKRRATRAARRQWPWALPRNPAGMPAPAVGAASPNVSCSAGRAAGARRTANTTLYVERVSRGRRSRAMPVVGHHCQPLGPRLGDHRVRSTTAACARALLGDRPPRHRPARTTGIRCPPISPSARMASSQNHGPFADDYVGVR